MRCGDISGSGVGGGELKSVNGRAKLEVAGRGRLLFTTREQICACRVQSTLLVRRLWYVPANTTLRMVDSVAITRRTQFCTVVQGEVVIEAAVVCSYGDVAQVCGAYQSSSEGPNMPNAQRREGLRLYTVNTQAGHRGSDRSAPMLI